MDELFVFGRVDRPLAPAHHRVILHSREQAEKYVNDDKPVLEKYQLYRLVPVSLGEVQEVVTVTKKVIL